MKKSFSFFSRFASIIFAVLFVFCLFSCAGFLTSNFTEGSVSFELDSSVIAAASRAGGQGDFSYRIDITVNGNKGFALKQTSDIPKADFNKCLETDKKITTTLRRIPVGQTVTALVEIFQVYNDKEPGDVNESSDPIIVGKSSPLKVKSGENTLTIKAYNYRYDFPFSITITFDELSDADKSSIESNLLITAVPADSDDAKRVTDAGTDKYKIYEALYDGLNGTSQLAKTYGATFAFNQQSKKLTVTGNMSLPVNIDEAATKGQDVILVATIYNYNSAENKLQTKLFGQSEKITPVKGNTNTANIRAKKLNVLDTQIVTYNYHENYNKTKYFIDGNFEGTFVMGAKNFAFDSDGYFYTLIDSDGMVAIASNKPGFEPYTIGFEYSYGAYFITIDNVTDTVYVSMNNGVSWSMDAYPSLISTGNTEKESYFFYADPSDWTFSKGDPFVVNNGIVYAIGKMNNKAGLIIFDSKDVTEGLHQFTIQNSEKDRYVDFGWDDYGFCKPIITDMYYSDNAVYILIKDYFDNMNSSNPINGYNAGAFVSHGVIIKYDVSTGLVSDLGWSNEKLLNTEIPDEIGMYVGAQGNIFYKTNSYENPVVLFASNYINNPTIARTAFPSFYTPNCLNRTIPDSKFYGPDKIIGIKPKKLIIADDGTAFYTDNFNAIKFKNVNRIITIDLEKFAIVSENIKDAEPGVTFSSENFDDMGKNATFGGSFWGDLSITTRYLDTYNDELDAFVLQESQAGSLYLAIPQDKND